MKIPFCAVMFGALLLAGCGDNAGNPPQTTNAAAGAPAPAGDNYGSALANSQNRAVSVIGLTSLQEAVRNFNISEGRYPKDLNELTNGQFISRIPPAPMGKKYDYNPATGEVKVVNQ